MRPLLLLAALLALGAAKPRPAKPLVLYVGSGEPGQDQALARALEAGGRQARDVAAEERAYHCGGAPCPWAQGVLDAPVPEAFPAEARADLARGLKACRAWPDARLCGRQLADALWERHLASTGAEALLRLSAFGGHRGVETFLIVEGLREPVTRELTGSGSPSPEVIADLVARYLRGEGQARPREVAALPGAEAPSRRR